MAEKVTLKIAAHLAPLVKGDMAAEEKLQAVRLGINGSPVERTVVLCYLAHDRDERVRTTAAGALHCITDDELVSALSSEMMPLRLLEALARLLYDRPVALSALASRNDLSAACRDFIAQRLEASQPESASAFVGAEEVPAEPEESQEELDEESEEFLNKYQLSQIMGTADKIKMALTGDKEWRTILLKDSNKLVSGSVIKNPRITESEILAVSKSSVQNDEIIRLICANKEWIKNYQIRKALVENHKTPLPNALRYLATLSDKDVGFLAKSKNISTVIATQARRIMANKQNK